VEINDTSDDDVIDLKWVNNSTQLLQPQKKTPPTMHNRHDEYSVVTGFKRAALILNQLIIYKRAI
jgi:hypothetical protein